MYRKAASAALFVRGRQVTCWHCHNVLERAGILRCGTPLYKVIYVSAWIYWIPFVTFSLLSFAPAPRSRIWLYAAAVILIVWVGLRHDVGADWGAYLEKVEEARVHGLFFAIRDTDLAYAVLMWLGANGLGGIYFVNLVCAILAVAPLVAFCATRKNPALALLVATPYLISVVYMGYTRQGVAVGLGMLALLALERQRVALFLLAITMAALFHKAAVCLFILSPALFAGRWDRSMIARAFGIGIYAAALTALLFWREAGLLSWQYLVATGDAAMPLAAGMESNTRYHSQGAIVRIAQSLVAVAGFVIIARRSRLSPAELWLWSLVSACILFLFVAAFFRSTLADRLSLFFLPLQIYAFSTLPHMFGRPVSHLVQGAIIVCFAASFWVWQFYSSDSAHWIPYQSILTRLLMP
jgi:hypothetical protein